MTPVGRDLVSVVEGRLRRTPKASLGVAPSISSCARGCHAQAELGRVSPQQELFILLSEMAARQQQAMKHMAGGSVAASLVALLLMGSAAWGGEKRESGGPIASVVAARGEVEATRDGGARRTLKVKDPVYQDDSLRTGAGGRLQVLFTDGTIIGLGHRTELVIVGHAHDAKARAGEITVRVGKGVFQVMGGALAQVAPVNIEMKGSAATVGVRGAFYAARLVEEGLKVVSLGGEAVMVSARGGKVVLREPSFGTLVSFVDGRPARSARLGREELAELCVDLRGGEERARKRERVNPQGARCEFAGWGYWARAGGIADGAGALSASEGSLSGALAVLNDLRETMRTSMQFGAASPTSGGGCPGGT